MSLFYKSNEAKERKYVKENKIRELNDEAQQEIVDEQIDKELGLDRKATNIGLLSKRVIDKLVNAKSGKTTSANDTLLNAINNGKLSELFKELKSIPEDYLNDTQKNIKLKLSNPQAKEIINDLIANAVDMGNIKELNKIVLNELISVGNKKEQKDLNEMLNMTSAATSVMSDAPQKIDGRMFNKGKKKDTNAELNEFSNLLIQYENAPRGRKGPFNQKLKNIIGRQRLINPKTADRMLQMKNAITNTN